MNANPENTSAVEVAEALALRRPDTAITLADLASRKGEALEIIEARVQILTTLRSAAIRATSPEDWLLFRSPDGLTIGYLQDCGCDRVRDLYGIEVYGVSRPERIASEAGTFTYLVEGSGRCNLTRQVVEQIEGGRSSTDDFCKDKTGADLELAVRKAARANLDGNITRELAGMKSVPVDELKTAWAGTSKTVERCRLGRGFGGRGERQGVDFKPAGDPSAAAIPKCPHCGSPGRVNKAGKRPDGSTYQAFIGCSKYGSHPDKKWILNYDEWQKQQAKPAAEPPSPEEPPEPGSNG